MTAIASVQIHRKVLPRRAPPVAEGAIGARSSLRTRNPANGADPTISSALRAGGNTIGWRNDAISHCNLPGFENTDRSPI
jgi:hypothetical protein